MVGIFSLLFMLVFSVSLNAKGIDLKSLKSAKADLVIFSFDRPLQLEALLRSIKELVTGLDRIIVIYRTSNDAFEQGYKRVIQDFPLVTFTAQSRTNPHGDFKELTLRAVFNSPSHYIIFAVDDMIVKDYVNITECILALEENNAYGFYLRLGNHVSYSYMLSAYQGIPPLVSAGENIYAWQFSTGAYDWRYPTTTDMTLYRKEDLRSIFKAMSFKTPNNLENLWLVHYCPDLSKIGLCYGQSKVVNIPLNQVMQDFVGSKHMGLFTPAQLLEKFNQNLRMDIRSLIGIKNTSAHMEWIPQFYSIAS